MQITNHTQARREFNEPTQLQKEISRALLKGKKSFLLWNPKKPLRTFEISSYAVNQDGVLCYSELDKVLWFEQFCSDETPIFSEGEWEEIELFFDHVRVKKGELYRHITLNGKESLVFPSEEEQAENPPYIPESYQALENSMRHHAHEKEFNQLFPEGKVLAYHPSGLILESESKIYFYITQQNKACCE